MPTYASGTDVPSDRSRAEIERTLKRYGAKAFAYAWEDDEEMVATIMFKLSDRQIRFRLTMPSPKDRQFTVTPTGKARAAAAAEAAYEQAVRQRWRALALVIKAKLEAVEAGISTVEDEFLHAIMLPNGSTVGEWAAPQLREVYGRGTMPALMPGSGDRG
jgi:hypothetical protein